MRRKLLKATVGGLCLSFLMLPVLMPELLAHREDYSKTRRPVCLKEFPTEPSLFIDIVEPFVEDIIATHGMEEWKAVVLTNELHRHLGMWSILGAKMGIRAREVLNAPLDKLTVISMCGHKPPYGCTNDGLQVSTGVSPGRATLSITEMGQPEAIFLYNGRRLRLRIKPEVKNKVDRLVRNLSERHGFQSEKFYQEIDKASVRFWLEWKRDEIFNEFLC